MKRSIFRPAAYRPAACRLAAACLALAVCGCSNGNGFTKTFGLKTNPPDAFAVGTQPPLSLPPELGHLPPPSPGEPRPQFESAAQQGLDTLSPSSSIVAPPGSAGAGEQALLSEAGPPPPPDIRAQVNQDALIDSRSPGFVSGLMGSTPAGEPTVNAPAESRRLQENAALGQPATDGETPVQTNKKPGFLGRAFNWF